MLREGLIVELVESYRAYIDCLNRQCWAELGRLSTMMFS